MDAIFEHLGDSNAYVVDDINYVIDLAEHSRANLGRFCVQEGRLFRTHDVFSTIRSGAALRRGRIQIAEERFMGACFRAIRINQYVNVDVPQPPL